ncbi:hypothetical protein ACQJBY_026241 [Aegilops geniculata]
MVLLDCLIRVGHRVFPARRRLTLAPGAIDPGSGSAAKSPAAGSRFEPLAMDEVTDLPEAEGVAVQAANMVLSQADHDEEGGPWTSVSRRKKSKEELVQEFWNDVGFPTPASRVWERRGSASPETSASQECLGSSQEPSARPDGAPKSPNPSPATPRQRRGVCIKPWRGPLPRPRITPPVALAAFMPDALADPSSSAEQSQGTVTLAATHACNDHASGQTTLRPMGLLHAEGPSKGQAARLGRTIRRADVFLRQTHLRPNTASVCAYSRTAPPTSYAAALRRPSPHLMAGRNGNTPKGPPLAGVETPNPGAPAGFGAAAGPFRFGASSSSAHPSGQRAAPTAQAPVVFGAGNTTVPDAAARRNKTKRKGGRRDAAAAVAVPPAARPPPIFPPPATMPALTKQVPEARDTAPVVVPSAEATGRGPKGKGTGLWCFKCRSDDHLSKDCTAIHFCHICVNYKHPLHRCHVLKQPRPTASLGGCGLVNAMFLQLPDMLFKEHLAPPTLPTALVTISGGSLTAAVVEVEVAKIASVQTSWKWEAVPHGDNAFLVCFPSVEVLKRVSAFEYNVKSQDVKIAFSEWKVEEVSSILPLQPVWVHVTGVPPPLRHFLGLWAVGSVIGATQDVDLVCLRRHGIVRIQVAVHSLDIFTKKDGSDEASVSSDVYIKLNGYAFRFVLEEEDFVPDVDFSPQIWENHDDGHDDGANRDEVLPDRDANKRSKGVQAVDQNSASGSQVSVAVPMQSTQRIVHTDTLESSVVSLRENMGTHMHVPVVQESMDTCTPMQDELEKGRSTRCTTMHATDAANDSAIHVKAAAVVTQPTAAISVCFAGHAAPASTPLQPALTPAAHATLPASVGVQESRTLPAMESPVRAAVAVVPLGPATDRARGSSSASDAGVPMGPATCPSSPTIGTLRTTPALQRTTSTTLPKTLTGTTSGGLATPLRRSNRHSLNADGSSSTDEHSLAKAMRHQASRNLDPMTGYFPLYALASYVVYASTSGVPTAIQGGVYAVGAGGYGGFYPTWMAA